MVQGGASHVREHVETGRLDSIGQRVGSVRAERRSATVGIERDWPWVDRTTLAETVGRRDDFTGGVPFNANVAIIGI